MKELRDYSEYDVIAFGTDAQFQDWVLSGLGDEYWTNVLKAYPGKINEIEEAKRLLLSIDFRVQKPGQEVVEEYLKEALEKIIEKEKRGEVHTFKSWGWAAAAVAVFVFGYWLIRSANFKNEPQTAQIHKEVKDLEPGGNRAVLTLADGTQVVLDSAENGRLANQGNVAVIKMDDGELSYQSNRSGAKEVLYNTVSTPAGGMYQLVLSDGTKVWLNAKSSLKFPTVFAGNERKVELTGEGYFEVAHNADQPFYVNAQQHMEVRVLGTHFNVKAYTDEPNFQTTLLEGKVIVSDAGEQTELNPGQQAKLDAKSRKIKKTSDVDLNYVMAWKRGEFNFDETELKDALRTLSRWYDFEVDYGSGIDPIYVYGSISRGKNLSEVLKIMEASGIHFKMERVGKINRLIVLK